MMIFSKLGGFLDVERSSAARRSQRPPQMAQQRLLILTSCDVDGRMVFVEKIFRVGRLRGGVFKKKRFRKGVSRKAFQKKAFQLL
jgi:hypothetical protein